MPIDVREFGEPTITALLAIEVQREATTLLVGLAYLTTAQELASAWGVDWRAS
jgi:hypothetical protein